MIRQYDALAKDVDKLDGFVSLDGYAAKIKVLFSELGAKTKRE